MVSDKEHVKLVEELFDEKKKLFVEKNSNYGCSYLKAGRIMDVIMDGKPLVLKTADDHIAYQILVRRLDKITRFCNLRFGDEDDKVGESISETLGDDGVYALMASSYEKSRTK